MLTHTQAFYNLKNTLQPLYDEREAAAMAHELLYHLTGMDKTRRLINKDTGLTEIQRQQYELSLNALAVGTPLQYVTGTAWFMGKEYRVNKHVLIPRPETEELVQWVIDDLKNTIGSIKILDIGTGSGCIPISLKSALPNVEIAAIDLSHEALEVAKRNAETMQTEIQFLQMDFLDAAEHHKLTTYDVIVSNPPYIPTSEQENMHENVKNHEPHMALFVPDNDVLLFYRAIALFGKQHLNQNGYIYCELDAAHAIDCKTLFESEGYKTVEIRKDMHGNWRLLKAGNWLIS